MNEEQKVRVGVGVMILKDGKVLLGKRNGEKHGAGEYAFTGGHVEFGESIKNCAIRETREEAGIEIKNIRFLYFCNLLKYGRHYAHIGVIADWKSGEVQLLEPEKIESWDWYDLDNLPEPLFEGAKLTLDSYKTGRNFYDSDED